MGFKCLICYIYLRKKRNILFLFFSQIFSWVSPETKWGGLGLPRPPRGYAPEGNQTDHGKRASWRPTKSLHVFTSARPPRRGSTGSTEQSSPCHFRLQLHTWRLAHPAIHIVSAVNVSRYITSPRYLRSSSVSPACNAPAVHVLNL